MSETSKFVAARENLWGAQIRFGCFPRLNVEVNGFEFCMQRREPGWERQDDDYIGCFVHTPLLARCLRREINWNSLEVSMRVLFDRKPNEYCADFHTLMCFFRT